MQRIGTLAIGLLFLCGVAGAADYTWLGNSANWDVEAEWVPTTGGPPGTGETAAINAGTAIANTDLGGPPDEIIVQTGGVLRLQVNGLADHNLVLDGGRLEKTPSTSWTARVYDHELKVKSASEIGNVERVPKLFFPTERVSDVASDFPRSRHRCENPFGPSEHLVA